MTNLEALKKLYADLGGTASDVANMDTSSEVIEALSAVAGGGGSSAPIIVTFNCESLPSSQSSEYATCNMTYNEVIEALEAGKTLFARITCDNYPDNLVQDYCAYRNTEVVIDEGLVIGKNLYFAGSGYLAQIQHDNQSSEDTGFVIANLDRKSVV